MIYLTTDTEITGIADAIRYKGGTSSPLTYPVGFANAIYAIQTGSGSGPLSLEIAIGSTPPIGGSERLIWANTIQPITSIVISNINDTPSNPSQGMFWLGTSITSNVAMPISTNPRVMIYPWRGRQYIDGYWSTIPCSTYLNGAWVKWSTTIFTVGDPLPDLSGSGGSVQLLDSGVMSFKSAAEYDLNRRITVDLTYYSQIFFRGIGQRSGTSTDERVGIASGATTWVSGYDTSIYPATNPDGTTTDRTIDISSLVGEYYIRFYVYKGARTLNIYHVELIP